MAQHQMRVDPMWRSLLLIGGVTRERAFVDVGDDAVRFRFGFFDETVALSNIESVEEYRPSWLAGIGIRAWPGFVGLFGSHDGCVSVTLRESMRISLLPMTPRFVPVRRIGVSMRDAGAVVADVNARLALAGEVRA